MNPDLQLIGVTCQVIVVFIFIGSFFIGLLNLKAFNTGNHANTIKHVMDEYKTLIKENTFEHYNDELVTWKQALSDSQLTPHSFYYNRLKHISAIGAFYDYVGVLVKKKIIKFELLFEILPFPHQFWEKTTELRETFKEISYSEFWHHFEYLHELYTKERKKREPPVKKEKVLQSLKNKKNLQVP